MKLNIALFLTIVTNLFSGCEYFSCNEVNQTSNQIGMLPEEDRKYILKSVIIKMKSAKQILGSDIESTIYFDDYGDKFCNITETKLKYKGTTIVTTSINITRNDYTYTYNPEKLNGTKSKNKGNINAMHVDFASMDAQSLESNGIRKGGNTEWLGRECEVFILDNPALEMVGRYEVWNKIPLKFATKIGSSEMEMYAVEISENTEIPTSVFELPANVEFIDASNLLTSSTEPALSDSLLNLPASDK